MERQANQVRYHPRGQRLPSLSPINPHDGVHKSGPKPGSRWEGAVRQSLWDTRGIGHPGPDMLAHNRHLTTWGFQQILCCSHHRKCVRFPSLACRDYYWYYHWYYYYYPCHRCHRCQLVMGNTTLCTCRRLQPSVSASRALGARGVTVTRIPGRSRRSRRSRPGWGRSYCQRRRQPPTPQTDRFLLPATSALAHAARNVDTEGDVSSR